jgi:hypothetical protein
MAIVIALTSAPAWALPDWGRPRSAGGEVVYPDHEQAATWYYAPPEPRVVEREGAPAFRFDLFRYVGRTETGDAGTYRTRAVLSVDFERVEPAGRIEGLRRALAREGQVQLRPLPLDRFQAHLLYATIEDGAAIDERRVEGGRLHGAAGLEAGETSEPPDGLWTRRRYSVALQPLTAQVFADGFDSGRLLLSLAFSHASRGVVWDVLREEFVAQEKEGSSTVPIRVARQEHPQLFGRHETWSTLRMARTTLLVTCYDFIDEEPTTLHRVEVEVKFSTRRGQDHVSRVVFEAQDSAHEKEVSFRLARDLERPYEVRVTRIFRDRPRQQGPWAEHRAQQVDVSLDVPEAIRNGEEEKREVP